MPTETCADMKARLASYVAARDAMVMGKSVTAIAAGEKHLQFGPGDSKRLDSLIADLRSKIARCCPGNGRPRRILYVTPSDGR